MSAFRKLLALLDESERRQAAITFLLMLLVAITDAVGVASIMPFIALLSNPEAVASNRYLHAVYAAFGFTNVDDFMLLMGFVVFALLVLSLIFRGLGLWAQFQFSQLRSHAWSTRLISGYLRQPYEWFLSRHSAQLASSIISEVERVVNGALFPALQATAQGAVVVVLLGLLLVVDPVLAIQVAIVIGGAYAIVFVIFRPRIVRLGKEWLETSRRRHRIVHDSFVGIKDVKASGLEDGLIRQFENVSHHLATRAVASNLIQHIPNIAMQGILFGGMLLVLLYLMTHFGGFEEALPVLGLYAFAGYRLMPALQTVYREVSQLRSSEAALDALAEDLRGLNSTRLSQHSAGEGKASRLTVGKSIALEFVSYRYPNAEAAAVQEVSIDIPVNSTIGIVGATGSGKSTTIDIMLGLLHPQGGRMLVDGIVINRENVRMWQRALGYVPQQMFLLDDTIAANIAFGVPEAEVDDSRVRAAARVANLHEFVERELPEGYQTHVGEHGVRLSGGQRQRIIIARAMYHDPEVLILDEATSALDNLTEHAVIDALRKIGRNKTIVMVAHRLSTVRNCDTIYVFESGKVVDAGTYDDLLKSSARFQAMLDRPNGR